MSILSERAMLSVLNLSAWTAVKKDRKVTREVLLQHNARSDAGQWNKRLVSKDALAEIALIHGQAREYHRIHTLPWLDKGPRLLPATFHSEYEPTMLDFQERSAMAVSRFVEGYPDFVADARIVQNGMFSEADYPSSDRIERKFGFRYILMPVPDEKDFRVDISETVAERIRESVRAANDATIKGAITDIAARAHEVLSEMATSLRGYHPATKDHKATGIFRDTLVSNVADLAALIPGLNIADDPTLAWLATSMQRLSGIAPDTLRTDSMARATIADNAQAIIDHVSSFMD